MPNRKSFIFFLVQTQTGLCYYKDTNGNTQLGNIRAGTNIDYSLQHAPDGWLQTKLGFDRNSNYYSIFQQYTVPSKFVYDAYSILKEKQYGAKGFENQFTLLVYKYNENPVAGDPTYKVYAKQQLDTPKMVDMVGESMQVNLKQSGAALALKAYEDKMIEIPCDGSLNVNFNGNAIRNKKVNIDGMYYKNTVYYDVEPIEMPDNAFGLVPMNITSQDGQSVNTIVSDQSYQVIPTGTSLGKIFPQPAFFQGNGGFAYEQVAPSQAIVEGTIIVKPFGKALDGGTDHTQDFVLGLDTPDGLKRKIITGAILNQQTTLTFKTTITLRANEPLFLNFYSRDLNILDAKPGNIVGGQIELTYLSIAPPTRAWCTTLWDVFQYIIYVINQESKLVGSPFSFGATSTLLQKNLNLVLTSGDALRASGDPTFQKFYNTISTNPNLQVINLSYSYGPVIKISLKEFFESISAIMAASMGTIQTSTGEKIFFESINYVYQTPVDNTNVLILPEVSGHKVEYAYDKLFNIFKVGYQNPNYDFKSGKYEPNTQAEFQAKLNLLTEPKTFEKVSKIRADATGIEDLRSNINGTSTTRNGGDNEVFIINTDPSIVTSDFWSASFTSLTTDTGNPFNTNIILKAGQNIQPVQMVADNGEFFQALTDQSIFVLNQVGLSGTAMDLFLNLEADFTGYPANALNGTPADFAIITLYVNGVAFGTPFQVFASGATNHISLVNYGGNRNWNYKDTIWVGIQTSANGTVNIDSASMTLGPSGSYMNPIAAGGIVIDPGTNKFLLSFATPNVSLDVNQWPKVSYGFQYFKFNSVLLNSDFKIDFSLKSVISGGTANVDVFLNGVSVYNNAGGPGGTQRFDSADSFNETFNLGDIIFIGASTIITTGSGTNMEIQSASLTMTSLSITAVGLKRVKYDYLIGIPNYAYPLDANGRPDLTKLPDSSLPGAPYNLDYLTPKQMLLRWGGWIRSCLSAFTDTLYFSTLSKNQFLSTTVNGVTTTENADVMMSALDPILFQPFYFSQKSAMAINFAELMFSSTYNHIGFYVNGNLKFGFAESVSQESPLNPMQDTKLLCSPVVDMSKYIKINYDGLANILNPSLNPLPLAV